MKKIVIALTLALLLAINAGAVGFKPSVDRKTAPDIKKTDDGYIGEIIDDDENVVKGVTEKEIVITPISEADEAVNEKITEKLKKAQAELESAEDFSEIISGIMKAVDEIYPGKKVSDLVITDLFDMTLLNGDNEILEDENYRFRVTFNTKYTTKPIVAFRYNNGSWSVIDNATVKLNSDGTLTAVFDELGIVAFASADVIVDNPDVNSPKTGVGDNTAVSAVTVALSGFAIVAVVGAKRKKRV